MYKGDELGKTLQGNLPEVLLNPEIKQTNSEFHYLPKSYEGDPTEAVPHLCIHSSTPQLD